LSPRHILISLVPLLIGIGVWLKDGARVAFWLTSVEEKKEIPIVDGMPELGTQTQIIWKEQFVSGVESPLLGLFVTLTLFLLIKQGLRKKKSNDK
tara:strand:- start:200 stop:484 length:285 start_codon:yes stop_codon:yes gene_type:complete